MDISLREAQETIFNIIQGEEQRSLLSIKELCHCRFYDLPPVPEFHKPSVGMIRSDDLGRLVQFSGTVIRTGMVWLIVGVNCRSRCWKLRKNTNVRILAVAVDSTKTRASANLCNSSRSKCVFSIDFHSGQRRVLRLRRNSHAGANPDAGSGHNASFHHDYSVKRSRWLLQSAFSALLNEK